MNGFESSCKLRSIINLRDRFTSSVRRGRLPIFLGAVAVMAACGPEPTDPANLAGTWRAVLGSPGGELPFGLEIEGEWNAMQATLINGDERIAIPSTVRSGESVTFDMPHYDSRIEATFDGAHRLVGMWTKAAPGVDEQSKLSFEAERTTADFEYFRGGSEPDAAALELLNGSWATDFASEDDLAVGRFTVDGAGRATGTFMTTVGDYRFLAGELEGRRLRLTVFDGAHAFLFDATLDESDTLSGEFWSRDSWHDTWTATRDDEIELADGWSQTKWVAADDGLAEIQFPDPSGEMWTLTDERLGGGPKLIYVFGTWCPNCSDATQYLVELHRRYRGRGLGVLGLAFEFTGNFERDAAQIGRYRDHHDIGYPILVAGISDKDEASKRFPALDRVRAYPTILFVDDEQRVRGIYTGFNGPATGAAHQQLRDRFEALIEELLS